MNQVYSLRYGTIPVVHATGALADTVVDGDEYPRGGTGFAFTEYSGAAFLTAVDRALDAYADARRWRIIMRRAMDADFGWLRSARAYGEVYEAAQHAARGVLVTAGD
jgi:starch synthase